MRDDDARPVRVGWWTKTGPSMLARRTGTLVVENDCLIVSGTAGARTLPLFAYGTATWDAGARTLVYAGRTYAPGDVITLGGGAVPIASLDAYPGRREVPACGQAVLFLVG